MEMDHEASDRAIVRSTVDLARHLGMEVVAEGVESQEALDELRALGCHLAQGFAISPPLGAEALAAWAAAGAPHEPCGELRGVGSRPWHVSYAWTAPATRRSPSGAPPTTPPSRPPRSAFREQLDAGYYAVVSEGEGQARQVTALPADADLVILRRPIAGGLMAARRAAPERAAVAWRAARRRAAPLRARGRLWTLSTAAHSVPFVATAGILVGRRAVAGAGRRARARARAGRSPSCTRTAARRSCGRSGGATTARGARPRSGCSATSSATRRASCTRAPAWCWSAGGSASGSWGRPARCSCAPAGAACTAGACAPTTRRCPPPTAPRTCCWRCARTRPASPPWPTSPSAARPGACAAGCPGDAPALAPPRRG